MREKINIDNVPTIIKPLEFEVVHVVCAYLKILVHRTQ